MTDGMTRRQIVIGVDGSASALQAALWAGDEAARRHLPVRLLHAVSPPALSYGGGSRPPDGFSDALQTSGRQWLADAEYPEVAVWRVVEREHPVRCLLEHTADAQLLVIGSRGRGGFSGMLTGSTSQALIHHATCPLVVVQPPTP